MELSAQLSNVPGAVLVVLAALVLIEIGLDVVALVDLYGRPLAQVVTGNKWIWVAIIVLVGLLGPILYLAIARQPAVVIEGSGPTGRPPKQVDKIVDSLYGTRDPTDKS
jgi:phospholipase D-like protein